MNLKQISTPLILLGLLLSADAAYAWSNPPAGTPPACTAGQPGCDAPLNVSNTFQSKDGNLLVNAGGTYATGFSVPFGNVGIGNASPSYKLDVTGTVNANQYCISGANCITSWPAGSTSQWTTTGSDIYYNTGNVGVGTASPAGKLTVQGDIRGTIFYDQDNTGYYLDPSSNSYIGDIQIANGSLLSGWPGYSGLTQLNGQYIYPGFLTGQGSGWNQSYYLAGSTSWGLYTNTSLYTAGCIYPQGYGLCATSASYGSFRLVSTAGGYYGILMGDQGTASPNWMWDTSGNGGMYYQNSGLWSIYFTRSSNHWSINTSADLGYALGVSGGFAATYKNFVIPDPLDPENKVLVHSSIEGPEHAVYYRGEAELVGGKATIELPVYFEALTRKENRTVLLTNIDGFDQLAVKFQDGVEVKDSAFMVYSSNPASSQKFNWEVKAVRADVPVLVPEQPKPADK